MAQQTKPRRLITDYTVVRGPHCVRLSWRTEFGNGDWEYIRKAWWSEIKDSHKGIVFLDEDAGKSWHITTQDDWAAVLIWLDRYAACPRSPIIDEDDPDHEEDFHADAPPPPPVSRPESIDLIYKTLCLTSDAPAELVESARRILAKRHHPDVGGDNDVMREINRAADVILESMRR